MPITTWGVSDNVMIYVILMRQSFVGSVPSRCIGSVKEPVVLI